MATTVEAISGLEKVAIVLISMGPAASANILKHFSEEEVESVTSAIARMGDVSSDQVEGVLEEFNRTANANRWYVKGGVDYAQQVLVQAFGNETANKMLDRLVKEIGTDPVNFDNFRRVDPQQLAKFIQEEHPQTIALVLSHLDPSQAAGLLSCLPREVQPDVALRMATLDQISPEVIRSIAGIIAQKVRALGEVSRESCGGVRAVADLFNRLDSATCTQLLDALETANPPLFETVRRLMFVFEDLHSLDQGSMRELLGRVDRKVLTTALKGTSDQLRKAIFDCQTQRSAEMLKEDLEALGPVKIREVDEAQQKIITLARQMEKEGTLSLKGSSTEQVIN
ncbi:MAG TPA: flagellar motor switch protein FliG [Bryobacteraceae bacterium]|nr:flagellar motor switch protein FliG [Bryobacteraceae bacterium]